VDVVPGPHGLDDGSDLASILDGGVADAEVAEGDLVAERDALLGVRAQGLTGMEVAAFAVGVGGDVDDRDTDVVRGFVNEKLDHASALLIPWLDLVLAWI